jgi:hypothetical protein
VRLWREWRFHPRFHIGIKHLQNVHANNSLARGCGLRTTVKTYALWMVPKEQNPRRILPMSTSFSGGCACRAIRYTSAAEPIVAWNCHCCDCQRASGGAYTPVFYVVKSALTITGEIKYHKVQTKSGNTNSRGFCPECGSPLFAAPSLLPAFMGIFVGSLDDPSWVRPTIELWTVSAQPWDHLNPALSKVETQPTSEQLEALFDPHRQA